MLGLIHITWEEFIKAEFGDLVWQQVLAKAGLSASSLPLYFETHCPYADALFYSSLDAASKITGVDVEDILRRYGRHFLLQAREQGYEKLLVNFSSSFAGFLANLNNLHLHLSLGVPSMMTPDFRVTKLESNSLELHYYSMREGFGPLVEGMVQGLADIYYSGLTVNMQRLGGQADKSCTHEVWKIIFPEDQDYVDRLESAQTAAENSVYAMDAPTFYRLQPFHFILDRQCKVLQVGSVLQRILPDMKKGSKASEHLRVATPYACQGDKGWDFDELVSCENLCFILKGCSKVLELKGQFVRTRLPPTQPPPPNSYPAQSQPFPQSPPCPPHPSCTPYYAPPIDTLTPTSPWLQKKSCPHPTHHPTHTAAHGTEPCPQQHTQHQQRGAPNHSSTCAQPNSVSAAHASVAHAPKAAHASASFSTQHTHKKGAHAERRHSSLWGNFSIGGEKDGSASANAARRSMARNGSEGSNVECVERGGKGEGDGGVKERGAGGNSSGGSGKPKKQSFAALKTDAFLQKLGLGSAKSAKPSTRTGSTDVSNDLSARCSEPPTHAHAPPHPSPPPSAPHSATSPIVPHCVSESSHTSTSNNPSVHKDACFNAAAANAAGAAGAASAAAGGVGGVSAHVPPHMGPCPMASLKSTHLGTFSAHQPQPKTTNQAPSQSQKSAPVGFLEPPMILQQQQQQQAALQQQAAQYQQSTEGQEVLLFLGSPRMLNLDEMRSFGMTLEDVPLYDMSSEFVVMSERLEKDKRTRLMLLDERAVLEARAEMLAQQNAAQEAAYMRMGEALEEALQQRDESYGVQQPEGGSRGFQVETPAEKALDLLDKIMHGINPDMREVLEVRDAILMAGVDLRAPMRLQDQVATELNRSNLDDEEVQAALTQLLAVDGGKRAGTHSHWSLSDSSENEDSSDSDNGDAVRRSSAHESLKGLKRAVSGTLEIVKAPFTSGRAWAEGAPSTQDGKRTKPRPRKSPTQIAPKLRPPQSPSMSNLRTRGSVPDTLAEEPPDDKPENPRRSSSFSEGIDTGTGPSDSLLSKQLRSSDGRRDLSQRVLELLSPAPTLMQPFGSSPRNTPRVHSPPPTSQGVASSSMLSPKHSEHMESFSFQAWHDGPSKAGTPQASSAQVFSKSGPQPAASGDTERVKNSQRGLGKCKSTTNCSESSAQPVSGQVASVINAASTGKASMPVSAPEASMCAAVRMQADPSSKLSKALKRPLRSLTGPLQSTHDDSDARGEYEGHATRVQRAARTAPAAAAAVKARTDSALLPTQRSETGADHNMREELRAKLSSRTDSTLPYMAKQEHTRARRERRNSLLAFYRDSGRDSAEPQPQQSGLTHPKTSGPSEMGFSSQRSSGGSYVPGALGLGTIQSSHTSLMTAHTSATVQSSFGPDNNSEPLPCIQHSTDCNARFSMDDNRRNRRMTRKARRRQSLLMALKPPEGVAQLLSPPSDPVLEVLAKVDDWYFNTFELNEVTNGRPLSTLAFALLSRSNLMTHFRISEVRLARFLVAVEDGYYDNPYHNRIHAADVLRTLHVIMTRGGVRQAMHTAHDIALLAAYIAAVVHDFEHKGVNNDFLVKTMDQLALIYNDRSPMENHHAAAAFQLLLLDEQCAAMSSTNHKVREALRKIVVDSVLATDMKSHFTFASHFNTKIPALLGFVRPVMPRPSSEAARKSLSLRRESLGGLKHESLHLPPGQQLGAPSSTNSLDMGHTAPACVGVGTAAHRASSLGNTSAHQSSGANSQIHAMTAPGRVTFTRQPTSPVPGTPPSSFSSHFKADGGSGTSTEERQYAHAQSPQSHVPAMGSVGVLRTRESGGSPLQHGSAAQQQCAHSTHSTHSVHSTHGTHSSSAFASAFEAVGNSSANASPLSVLSGATGATSDKRAHAHMSSSNSSHLLDTRESPRAAQQQQQQQQHSQAQLSEPLPRVDSGSQPSISQIVPPPTSSGQLPFARASISLARPSQKPGVSAAGRPSMDPLTLSHHAQHPRQLVIADEEMRTLVLQMALKCADLGHLAHKREVHRRWVMVLEEEMFRQGDREKAAGLPVSPLMDRLKGGISKSQAGFFSIVALPQLEAFCKVFPACRPMLEQAQDNYRMWLEESKTNTATTGNLISK